MNSTSKLSLALATILVVASAAAHPGKPSFVGCTSSEDCGADECCVLGMMRYSIPVCKQMGGEGDRCRPQTDDSPQNVTVSYPGGTSIDLNVHYTLCPCAAGLECAEEMTCSSGLDGQGRLVLREDYTDVDEINHLRR